MMILEFRFLALLESSPTSSLIKILLIWPKQSVDGEWISSREEAPESWKQPASATKKATPRIERTPSDSTSFCLLNRNPTRVLNFSIIMNFFPPVSTNSCSFPAPLGGGPAGVEHAWR